MTINESDVFPNTKMILTTGGAVHARGNQLSILQKNSKTDTLITMRDLIGDEMLIRPSKVLIAFVTTCRKEIDDYNKALSFLDDSDDREEWQK